MCVCVHFGCSVSIPFFCAHLAETNSDCFLWAAFFLPARSPFCGNSRYLDKVYLLSVRACPPMPAPPFVGPGPATLALTEKKSQLYSIPCRGSCFFWPTTHSERQLCARPFFFFFGCRCLVFSWPKPISCGGQVSFLALNTFCILIIMRVQYNNNVFRAAYDILFVCFVRRSLTPISEPHREKKPIEPNRKKTVLRS